MSDPRMGGWLANMLPASTSRSCLKACLSLPSSKLLIRVARTAAAERLQKQHMTCCRRAPLLTSMLHHWCSKVS